MVPKGGRLKVRFVLQNPTKPGTQSDHKDVTMSVEPAYTGKTNGREAGKVQASEYVECGSQVTQIQETQCLPPSGVIKTKESLQILSFFTGRNRTVGDA